MEKLLKLTSRANWVFIGMPKN